MKFSDILEYLISLPKSIYVNLRLLPFKQAIHLPIICRYNVKIISLKGKAILEKSKFGCCQIGFGTVSIFDSAYERTILKINGILKIDRGCFLGTGTRLSIGNKGLLQLGKGFHSTAKLSITCEDVIRISDNVITSWDVLIMDTDWHSTINIVDNRISKCKKPIFIGKNVWLCARAMVLKGSIIPDGCIVGANTVVNKPFEIANTLIAGSPASVKKSNISIYRPI